MTGLSPTCSYFVQCFPNLRPVKDPSVIITTISQNVLVSKAVFLTSNLLFENIAMGFWKSVTKSLLETMCADV